MAAFAGVVSDALPAAHSLPRLPLPASLSALAAVGGHAGMLGDGQWVYKPLQPGARGECELRFYSLVTAAGDPAVPGAGAQPSEREESSAPPAALLPLCAGIARAEPGEPGSGLLLVLEDLTRSFARPCVMDVKMGVQSWAEDASEAKILAERAKCPSQARMGLRVTGMRVWDATAGCYCESGRGWGHRLDEETLPAAFRAFLSDGAGGVRAQIAHALSERVARIRAWFSQQGRFRFYGSSLLLIYDGGETEGAPAICDVRMIDFAHVWPIPPHEWPNARDEGYLMGLKTLLRLLEAVAVEPVGKGYCA